MGSTIQEFVAEEFWLLIGVVTFAIAGLAAVSGFGSLAPAIAVIGWFLLAPIFLFWGEAIATAVFEEREPETAPREPKREEDAIDKLKQRYAAGEIDDAEFERRLERLLGVEDALEQGFDDSKHGEGLQSGESVDGSTAQYEAISEAVPEDDVIERE